MSQQNPSGTRPRSRARSLAERVKEDEVVYVANFTTQPRATVLVHFHVPGRTNKPYLLRIPPSPPGQIFPFEIYPSRLPEAALKEGADEFLRFIDHGILRYVPVKQAEEILQDPATKAEVHELFRRANSEVEQRRYAKRIMRGAEGDGTAASSSVATPDIEEGYIPGPGAVPRPDLLPRNPLDQLMQSRSPNHPANPSNSIATDKLAQHGVSAEVNPQLQGVMASYTPSHDAHTLRTLQSMRSFFSFADFNFIIQQTGQNSACARWAQQQLQGYR